MRQERDRESIWSVDRGTKKLYFALFIIQSIIGIGVLTWHTILQSKGSLDTTVTVWQESALIIATSAGTSVIISELGRYLMVLARDLEERLERTREMRRAEGREEGRAERQAEWEAWNNRRIAADKDGRPFDEPPPGAE